MPKENQSIFEKYFLKVLDESNMAGPGGVFGGELQGGEGQGGALNNTDWYAPDDTRRPSIFGGVTRRPGLSGDK
jgi:hypothetical protein